MSGGFGPDELSLDFKPNSQPLNKLGVPGILVADAKTATTIDPQINATWEAWQKKFTIRLPKGLLVKDTAKHLALSEGSGYGLVISTNIYGLAIASTLLSKGISQTSQTASQLFAGIENYASNKNGLYTWKLSISGKQLSPDSAADADLDVAYSLTKLHEATQKSKIKPPKGKSKLYYTQKAQALIDSFWKHEVIKRGNRLLIKPSDGSWPVRGDKGVIINPSYFMPYKLRALAKFDKNKKHDWQKLIADQYDLMFHLLDVSAKLNPKGQNPLPDQALCYVKKDKFKCQADPHTKDNEYDAIRIPFQIGQAAIYDNDPKAKKFLKAFLAKAKVTGFWTPKVGAGTNPKDKHGWNNELAMAMYGVGVKGVGGTFAAKHLPGYKKQLLTTFHKNYFGYTPNDANDYYKQSLILQAVIILFDK